MIKVLAFLCLPEFGHGYSHGRERTLGHVRSSRRVLVRDARHALALIFRGPGRGLCFGGSFLRPHRAPA